MSHRAREALGGEGLANRWMAEIIYNHGGIDIFTFGELEDLDEIVERGPDWNTIYQIVITLNRTSVRPEDRQDG